VRAVSPLAALIRSAMMPASGRVAAAADEDARPAMKSLAAGRAISHFSTIDDSMKRRGR
jgi:hypothetical protein